MSAKHIPLALLIAVACGSSSRRAPEAPAHHHLADLPHCDEHATLPATMPNRAANTIPFEVFRTPTGSTLCIAVHELNYSEIATTLGCRWRLQNSTDPSSPLSAHTMTLLDAARLANAISASHGLAPAYRFEADESGEPTTLGERISITWNRRSDGFRLPTADEAMAWLAAEAGRRIRRGPKALCRHYDVSAAGGLRCRERDGRSDSLGGLGEWAWDSSRSTLAFPDGHAFLIGIDGPDGPVLTHRVGVTNANPSVGVRLVRNCVP